MLPFTSIDFFLLFAGFLLFSFAVKTFLRKWVSYKSLLLIVATVYLIFFYPALWHLISFLVFGYLLYYIVEYKLKITNKLYGCLLLVAPMFFCKADFLTNFIAFAGLSYITFRIVQLYIDNNREEKPVAPVDFLLFLVFPATLLIGPIDRYKRFKGDIDKGYENLNSNNLADGWQIMLYGILQKYILSEFVNRYWLSHANEQSTDLFDMLNNMYAYSVYLYLDFAGYSSLAIGLGKMFGINVPENFKYPFLAVNPQDFWRRWHISLGDWLRDYVFRPYYKWLSSTKKLVKYPLLKQNSGLFITFFAMGLWNGFKGHLIISGCIFALYSVVHNSYVYYCSKNRRDVIFGTLSPRVIKIISIFVMFNVSCFALYVFSGRFPFIK